LPTTRSGRCAAGISRSMNSTAVCGRRSWGMGSTPCRW
jgi:hypothetical protein